MAHPVNRTKVDPKTLLDPTEYKNYTVSGPRFIPKPWTRNQEATLRINTNRVQLTKENLNAAPFNVPPANVSLMDDELYSLIHHVKKAYSKAGVYTTPETVKLWISQVEYWWKTLKLEERVDLTPDERAYAKRYFEIPDKQSLNILMTFIDLVVQPVLDRAHAASMAQTVESGPPKKTPWWKRMIGRGRRGTRKRKNGRRTTRKHR
jgi:hypothetical protein